MTRLGKMTARFVATGAFVGNSPYMPGTLGTLWGIAIAYFTSCLSPLWQITIILLVTAVAIITAGVTAREAGAKDPSSIVCDEIAGALVGFFMVPFTIFNALLVFIIFRFFDILKPWPIGLIDKRVEGGTGIVLDDLAAGLFTAVIVHSILWLI